MKSFSKKKEYPVQFMDFLIVDNDMWYAANGFNGLFRADLKTGISELVGHFLNEDKKMLSLYSGVCRWDDKLIFAPYQAKNIAVYDMTSKKFEAYEIPKFEENTGFSFTYKFQGIVCENSDIFFIGSTYPVIMQFNMLTRQIIMHFKWYEEFKKYGVNPDIYFFDRHVIRAGDFFYVSTRQNNILMKYNMKLNREQCIEIGDKQATYSALVYGQGAFWMIDVTGNLLVKCEEKTKEIQKVIKLPGASGNYDMVFHEDQIWIFSKRYQYDIETYDMVYDIRTNILHVLNLKDLHSQSGVIFAKKEGNDVYCMYPDVNYLYRFRYENEEIIADKLEFNYEDDLYDKIYKLWEVNGMFFETAARGRQCTYTLVWKDLNTFLLFDGKKSLLKDRTTNIGKSIWDMTN